MVKVEEPVGDRFQQLTKYSPDSLMGHRLDWAKRPNPFKTYEDALDVIMLPEVEPQRYNRSIVDVLLRRRSRRAYQTEAVLDLQDLSFLCWATQGVTASYGETLFRTAPSAGALYPVETYIAVRAVKGLRQGIYHYRVDRFALELLKEGDFSEELALACLGQGMVQRAQINFIWTAVIERSRWKYRQRGYRYIYLDAGHICQNLYLATEASGLGCCAIGAFFDDWVNSIIGVDGLNETAIYIASVGVPRKKEV